MVFPLSLISWPCTSLRRPQGPPPLSVKGDPSQPGAALVVRRTPTNCFCTALCTCNTPKSFPCLPSRTRLPPPVRPGLSDLSFIGMAGYGLRALGWLTETPTSSLLPLSMDSTFETQSDFHAWFTPGARACTFASHPPKKPKADRVKKRRGKVSKSIQTICSCSLFPNEPPFSSLYLQLHLHLHLHFRPTNSPIHQQTFG